jgi:hypothetical protein
MNHDSTTAPLSPTTATCSTMALPSTMKKLTFSIFALFLFAGTAAFAQNSAQATADASVSVVQELTLQNNTPIRFGTVAQSAGTVTLDPQTGNTDNGTGTTSAGEFEAGGMSGADVNVSYDNTDINLTKDGGGTIPFNATVNGADSGGGQGTSTGVADGDTVTLGSGSYFFWVGGTVDVAGDQAAGTYNGTFTLTVEYANY